MDAVVARVREARKALRIWFCLDTLEYLRRGGRIGKAQAWLGGTLKIKPILSLEYEIVPVERVRTAGRAFERMVALRAGAARQRLPTAGSCSTSRRPSRPQRLIERCREIFDSEPLFTSEVGPVIGTYTGPGLIGVGAHPARAAGLTLSGAATRGGASMRTPSTGPRPRRRIVISLRWRSTCARQSVRRATSPRRRSTDTAELHAVALDRAADLRRRALRHQLSPSVASGVGRGAVRAAGLLGGRSPAAGAGARADGLADLARLLDRHVRASAARRF